MDKDVWAITAPDKTISFDVIEPFHFADHLAFFRDSRAVPGSCRNDLRAALTKRAIAGNRCEFLMSLVWGN
jgi:hypothetical protein